MGVTDGRERSEIRVRRLRTALAIWGGWEVVNGALATFAAQAGANVVGWVPKFGWNPDILAMSAQYGMGLFLLGFVYLLAASDPVRFVLFVWVAVAEQWLGILIGFYGTFVTRTITVPQFFALLTINLVLTAVFLKLGPYGATLAAPAERAEPLPPSAAPPSGGPPDLAIASAAQRR
jgi:hypothetical protein